MLGSDIGIHLQLCFCLPDEHKLNIHSSCSSGLISTISWEMSVCLAAKRWQLVALSVFWSRCFHWKQLSAAAGNEVDESG